MAFPPVGVRLVAEDAASFDSALKVAGQVLDGFGATASSAAKVASGALSGMAGVAKSVLDPLGNLFDRIFNQVFRVLVRQAVREVENFIGSLAQAAIAGTELEKNLSRVKIGLDDVSKSSFAPLTNELGDLVAKAAPAFLGVVQAAETYLGGLGQNALAWGSNLITQFAQGMWDAVGQVLSVLTNLANLVSYWLSPGSPPRLLPDIDKWGTAAANEFFGGWAKADFSVFSDLSSTLTALIRSIPIPKSGQMDVVPDILGARQGIAAAVEELRASGSITKQTMDGIVASVGTADASVRSYLEAMIKLQAANADVKQAQDELNKVTKTYQDLLKPVDAEIAGITESQQQLADEQKKSLLQLVLKDPNASLSEKRQAQLEIERLDAEKRRRALLAEQKVAVAGAQTKLDAAKTAQQLAQDEYDARKAVIQVQTDQNNLLREQLRLMETAAAAAAKASGGGGKPVLAGFDPTAFDLSKFVPTGIIEKWGEFVAAFEGMWQRVVAALQPAIDMWNDQVVPAWNHLANVITSTIPDIEKAIARFVAFVVLEMGVTLVGVFHNVATSLDSLAVFWDHNHKFILNLVTATFEIILATISVTMLLISGVIAAALQLITGNVSGAMTTMGDTFRTSLDAILLLVGQDGDEFVAIWDGVFDLMAVILQKMSDNLNTTLNGWGAIVDTKLAEVRGFFKLHLDEIVSDFTGPLEAIQRIIDKVRELWDFLNTHIFHFPDSGGGGSLPKTNTSLGDSVNAPNPTGSVGSTFNTSSSTGATYNYNPTYAGSAPPPEQGFATMVALFT